MCGAFSPSSKRLHGAPSLPRKRDVTLLLTETEQGHWTRAHAAIRRRSQRIQVARAQPISRRALQDSAAGSFSRNVPSLVVSAAISVEETAERVGQIQG
jgi:hypothetical protein